MKNDRLNKIDDLLDKLEVNIECNNFSCTNETNILISNLKSLIRENNILSQSEINESKNQYQNLFKYSPSAIFIYDFQNVTKVNQAFLDMFGYDDESQIIGEPAMKTLVFPQDYDIVRQIKDKLKTQKIGFLPKVRLLKKDGSVFISENYASKILINGVPHLQVSCNEITERDEARMKLLASKKRFEELFESSPDALFINKDGLIDQVNDGFLNLFGYDCKSEVIGKSAMETTVFKDDYSIVDDIRNQLKEADFALVPKIRHIRKDGTVFFSESYVSKFSLNNVFHTQIASRNITRRIELETELIKTTHENKAIIDSLLDVLVRVDHKGVIELISPSIINYGFIPEELEGKKAINFYADQNARYKYIEEIKLNGQIKNFETQLITKSGDIVDVFSNGKIYIDKYGKLGIESVFRDITELKRHHRKLIENEHLLAMVNKNSPDIISLADKNFNLIYVNNLLDGYTYESVIGSSALKYVLEKDREKFAKYLNRCFRGEKINFEIEGHSVKDRQVWYSVRLSPIHEGGIIKKILIISTDITIKKRAQRRSDVINSISQKINSNIGFASFCDFIFTKIQTIKPYSNVYISTYNEEKKEISIRARYVNGIKVNTSSHTRVMGNGLTEYLIKRKEGLILNSAQLLELHEEEGLTVYGEKAESWIGVPIMNEGKVIGVFAAQNLVIKNYFTDNDLATLSIIGSQIGSLIQRKSIEKDLITQKERLALATKITKSGVWDWDILENDLIWDDVMYEIYDIEKHNFYETFETWKNCVHPDDLDRTVQEVEKAVHGIKEFDTVFRVVRSDNSIRFIKGVGNVLRSKDGRAIRMIGINWDVTKRIENEKTIRNMANIVSHSVDAIISSDLEGIVLSWNLGAENLLGFKAEDIIGKSINILGPRILKNEHVEKIELVKTGLSIENYETVQLDKKGNSIHVSMSIFPLLSDDGKIMGVSSILRDFSKQNEVRLLKDEFTRNLEKKVKERTAKLERARTELTVSLEKEKKLSELKSRFVSTASHQFRTPLSVIQAAIGILDIQKDKMEGGLQESFEKVHARIVKQISKMTELMDEVLLLGSLDNGGKTAMPNEVNIDKLCSSIANLYSDLQEDNREMKILVSGNSRTVLLDSNLIEHAISNLVSNAFKFSTGKRAPQMEVIWGNDDLIIKVRDFGIGIPKADINYLFDPFYRASNVLDISGSGLGTAIAKEYIELNKGKLEVSSELNVGTLFTITFKI